jgi:hypothetical protein
MRESRPPPRETAASTANQSSKARGQTDRLYARHVDGTRGRSGRSETRQKSKSRSVASAPSTKARHAVDGYLPEHFGPGTGTISAIGLR